MLYTTLEAAIEPWLQHMTWRRDYAQWRERRINQEQYQRERLGMLRDAAGPLGGLRLLDLGAGMGGFAVAAALAGAKVTAAEYNPAYCQIIALRAARYGLTLPILNTAGEALPLPTAGFDAVTAWDVLEHVRDPQQVLCELARVVRPGGVVLLTAINRRAWIDPHYHMPAINWLPRPLAELLIAWRGRTKAGVAFRDMQRLSEMHYFHYAQLVHLCEALGFQVRDLREEQLQAGRFVSRKVSRRAIRFALRALGLERLAYRAQRRWYVGMFELALVRVG
ncbi:class I SAM-dependent methyltransferase [Candidatus Viridilinea mediisalina]|uniref:Methyltransferase type 11 n=1 Tax=Candidatus Viridilinea mediisalina TaxID=2024553 RepID=A0A2A6RGS9_9CHLR|nr:class I SAM-dependent methyltransferase [Candidatus Viridilinea mediisalina]PDW02085.1 methyltransferase type 11 [Candidatus Viridilinea mediisalina]